MTRKLKNKLIERGYKAKDVDKIIKEYPFNNKVQLTTKTLTKSDNPPLVLPIKYSQACNGIRKAIASLWPDIEGDPQLNEIFPKKPMIAYKKNKTISNALVRSQVTSTEPNRPLVHSRPPPPPEWTQPQECAPTYAP